MGVLIDLLPHVDKGLRKNDGMPHFSEDSEFIEEVFLSPLVATPKAFNKHIRKVVWEGIRYSNKLIYETYKAYKLRMIQMGVEITLN